ncbi:MAG: hypothetical protein ACTSXD_11695 [Candidatus Heimdallarchaeaceae archaeon]
MNKGKEKRQGELSEFIEKGSQVGLDYEAYNILKEIKKQLIKKHKRNFSFSDAVRELKRRADRK